MNIYVGNVPYAATETDLEELFGEYGQVANATIIRDRDDGRSKGFGFVEMENQEDGERAIVALDGQEMMGRRLKVNPARENQQRGTRQRDSHRRSKSAFNRRESSSSAQRIGGSKPATHFHNPYTFIPTPPRPAHGFAGDFNPLDKGLDHASIKDGLWTGHIPIKLTTVTPLVLLKDDGRERDPKEPQIYDVYDRIPEPSLRGMLRSAYEVVTNSRYACFRNEDRLAYRMIPQESLKLVPAIIEKGKNPGDLEACLYPGTSDITAQRPKGPMYAAMLTRYHKNPKANSVCVGGYDPKTGDEVWAEIEQRSHGRWKVLQVWPKHKYPNKPDAAGKVVKGRVLITNENMDNKHNERIFFLDGANAKNPIKRDVTHLKETWRMRIQSYRDAHSENDIFNRKGAENKPWKKIRRGNGQQYDMGWSSHLYEDGKHRDRWDRPVHDALELQEGDMVYARCEIDSNGDVKKIEDLFPVMISRELYDNSPEDLLDTSLRPAMTLSELSPADRLFGWAPQQKQDSSRESERGYKSRIRVVCNNGPRSDIVKRFQGDGIPLAILGQPKPAQGRFYVAKDNEGTPQDDGISKSNAGYNKAEKKGLRGRKHYWPHKGRETENASEYWDPFVENQSQEYRRTDGKTDTQNRSIKGWIEPGTEFKASLYVQNLQPQEVGALLWLLSLSEDHCFRLGYGKPLGFGSIKMGIDAEQLKNRCLPLGTGADWQAYYADLNATPPTELKSAQQSGCIQEFKTKMETAYHKFPSFGQLPFISDFLQVLKGPMDNAPIHYPRSRQRPDPEGKNFEWFVANDRGKKRSLPKVKANNGLPYRP